MEAFEEMMLTGFIENYTSSCFGPRSNINEIFVQRRLMDAQLPFLPPDITDEEELRKQQELYRDLRWVHLPQQRQEISNQELLKRINQIGAAVYRLERGGRTTRGREGRGRQMRGAQQPPPPQQPQQRPLMGLGRPAQVAEGIPVQPPAEGQETMRVPARPLKMKRTRKIMQQGSTSSRPKSPPQ